MKKVKIFLCFVVYSILLFIVTALAVSKKAGTIILKKQREIEKKQKSLAIVNHWIKKKQQNKNLIEFLNVNNYCSVAIYGLGDMGRLLSDELREYVKISYGIDRRELFAEYPIYKIEDHLPYADMIIVTVVSEFEEIERLIKEKLRCPVYSIEDIIYFMN